MSNNQINREESSPLETAVAKFEKLIAEKKIPKGKMRAKIKHILGNFD